MSHINVIISVKDLASGALKRSQGAFAGFGASVKSSLKGVRSELHALGTSEIGRLASVGAVVGGTAALFNKAWREADLLEKSMLRLSSAAKITGAPMELLNNLTAQGVSQFKLSKMVAGDFVTEIAKITQKAGDLGQASLALERFMDLGAGRGLSAEETLKAIQQAVLGIDEGTDKLFNQNPIGLYERYAKSIGVSAHSLNDQQKAQAIVNAALEDGVKVQGAYAERLELNSGKLSIFKTRSQEAFAAFGQATGEARGKLLDFGIGLMNTLPHLLRAIQFTAIDAGRWWAEIPLYFEEAWIKAKGKVVDAINWIRAKLGKDPIASPNSDRLAGIAAERAALRAGADEAKDELMGDNNAAFDPVAYRKALEAANKASGAGGSGTGDGTKGKKASDDDAWLKSLSATVTDAGGKTVQLGEAFIKLRDEAKGAAAEFEADKLDDGMLSVGALQRAGELQGQMRGLLSQVDRSVIGTEAYVKLVGQASGVMGDMADAQKTVVDQQKTMNEEGLKLLTGPINGTIDALQMIFTLADAQTKKGGIMPLPADFGARVEAAKTQVLALIEDLKRIGSPEALEAARQLTSEYKQLAEIGDKTAQNTQTAEAQGSFWGKVGLSIRGAIGEMQTLQQVAGDIISNTLMQLGSAIADSFENAIKGTQSFGQALKASVLGAVSAMAKGFGQFYLLQAVASGAAGAWGAAAKYALAGAGLMALGGVLAGFAGGGGSSSGGTSSPKEAESLQDVRGATNLTIHGGLLDMSDPRQAKAWS